MKNQEQKQKKPSMELCQKILENGNKSEVRALFVFDLNTPEKEVVFKFRLWSRWFFPAYFLDELGNVVKDAPFHKKFDGNNLRVYRGEQKDFVNAGFRGSGKTSRDKLFIAFCILNDESHYRKFIKILASDGSNSKQITTDIYNMFVSKRVANYYQSIFEKSEQKREETMSSFTTSYGVKASSGTVGMEQRGDIQEEARPDLILFIDFETRKTLRSAVVTKSIWDNMEEARTGLSKNGGCIYEGNYLSERGNVHKLVKSRANILITPIIKDGVPTWSRFSLEDIAEIKRTADDFEGEYLCSPSAGLDIMFDRTCLNAQVVKEPLRTISGFKIFHEFNPSHRYGGGADVGGGVGLDHSTSVFIDFTQFPNRVSATYKSNVTKPDVFGYEIVRQCSYFGDPIFAPEANNHGNGTIAIMKQEYKDNLFIRKASPLKTKDIVLGEYGWLTTGATKPRMIFDLKRAVENGLLELSDPDIIDELKSYTRDDLMDSAIDPRLTTRHFDLLIACAIAWQMKSYADKSESERKANEARLSRERRIKINTAKEDYGLS